MTILILAFITLFLAVFSPCLVILQKCEQTKEIGALKEQLMRQQNRIQAQEHATWRRNKQMLMD
jgi:hypothetical protein